MERLTEEDYGDFYCLKKCHPNDCYCEDMNCPINNCGELIEALRKLGEYEKAEEQGLLVRLPVPIGTKVYMIASTFDCIYNYDNCKAIQKWKCEEDIQCEYERKSYYVKEIEFTSILKDSIGNSVFLTNEEAEKKLEEMKNERI